MNKECTDKIMYVKPQATDLGALTIVYGVCSIGYTANHLYTGDCTNGPFASAVSPGDCTTGGGAGT